MDETIRKLKLGGIICLVDNERLIFIEKSVQLKVKEEIIKL